MQPYSGVIDRPQQVREISATSPEAFDDFYRREYRQLVGLAFVLTGRHDVAEDLVQQAFTEAHRRWGTVGRYDRPGAWVRKVMVNRSRSRFRRLGSERRAVTRFAARPMPEAEIDEPATEVIAAIRRLPARQAQVIALQYWDDLPVSEIAECLDCSAETVKTHLKRARARLAIELAPLGEVSS